MAIYLVILSGFFHALWNVIAKHSHTKIAFLLSIQYISFIVFAPIALPGFLAIQWDVKVLFILVCSMISHGLYFIWLARAYTSWDLSQIYPIIRGSSSLMIPFMAVFFLNESLTLMGWLGVISIVVGIIFLGDLHVKQSDYSPLILSVGIGACVASYVLIDKLSLAYASPITVNWIGTFGNLFALSFVAPGKSLLRFEWQKNKVWIGLGSILAPLSYLVFLYASNLSQLAQLAPIREIGTVFGVAFGVLFLKEKKGTQRIIASIIVTIGILLLGLNR